MHCPHCGTPNHANASACVQCQAPFTHMAQAQPQPPFAGGQPPQAHPQPDGQPMLSPQAQPPAPTAPPSSFKEFLSFKKMLTPVIIQILFWIGVVGSVLGGLVQMRISAGVGIATLLVGPLVVRIYCELLMVVFRMNATLSEIAANTKR